MESKIAETEIFVISEIWFYFYQREPPEVFYKKCVLKIYLKFTGKLLLFFKKTFERNYLFLLNV